METAFVQLSGNGLGQSSALTVVANNTEATARKPFIEANTTEATLNEIQQHHLIPVFHKDNEPVISHTDFIEATQEVVGEVFTSERILEPSIRLSHPIKGRVPEARNKPASELLEWEKTLYYERMAFIVEIPSITDTIGGEKLSLTVGGVKAYNLDNLYQKKGADEHFKCFIGFKVSISTDLCVWSDGFASDIKVKNVEQLKLSIQQLVRSFDAISNLKQMQTLQQYSLSEQQFAILVGRCRMYQHLPSNLKKDVPELHFGDNQINSVCRDYYRDKSFCKDESGSINLWRLYNLFTSANRNSYIDTFLDRAVNATCFAGELASALEHRSSDWFLN